MFSHIHTPAYLHTCFISVHLLTYILLYSSAFILTYILTYIHHTYIHTFIVGLKSGEMKRVGQGNGAKKLDEIDTFDHLFFHSQNIAQAIHTYTDLQTLMCATLELLLSAAEARNAESSLRLKAYLKLTYALSDDRCLAYNPDLMTSAFTSTADSNNKKALFDPSFLFSAQPYGQQADNSGGSGVADYKELLAESNVAFILKLSSAKRL